LILSNEESCSWTTSFLDNDFLPKPKKEDGLGRGQYQTAVETRINRDYKGAANIRRLVSSQLKISNAKVRRAALSLPKLYNLDYLSKIILSAK